MKKKVNQAKKEHNRWAPIYMFGFEIPRDATHARLLDQQNGNTKWQDAEYAEIQQLMDYQFAQDRGSADSKPLDHQKIRCRMVYAVKHDGRHKARFVAGGHLTQPPDNSVYSSVVSLRSLRIII